MITVRVNVVCEGSTDVPFLARLVQHAGGTVGDVYDKGGAGNLDKRLSDYVQASQHTRNELWLVARDSDGHCPVDLRRKLIPGAVPDNFLLRIAHPMVEEWMLADLDGAACFFRISVAQVAKAQRATHPKNSLLQAVLAGHDKVLKNRFVRKNGQPGPEFSVVYEEFGKRWNVNRAVENSDSLLRANRALRNALAARVRDHPR